MPSLIALSTPVEKLSLHRAATDKIRQAIVSGAVAPGVRLTEIALANRMRLSRGTIRAALQQLVAEGLVVQRPYVGWEVTSLTARDAWELYTLRGALEVLAARFAAESMTAQGRQRLESAFRNLKTAANAGDRKATTDADFALHATVVSLSGHRRLAEQFALVERQVRMYIASTNARLPAARLVVREHEPLVRAIMRGNSTEAERRAREHCDKAGNDLVAHLKHQERGRSKQLETVEDFSASAQGIFREAKSSAR